MTGSGHGLLLLQQFLLAAEVAQTKLHLPDSVTEF